GGWGVGWSGGIGAGAVTGMVVRFAMQIVAWVYRGRQAAPARSNRRDALGRAGVGSDSRFSWRPLPVLARVERLPSSRSGRTSRSNACRRQPAAPYGIGGVEVCDRL